MKVVIVGMGAIGKERLRACEELGVEIAGIVEVKESLTDYPAFETITDAIDKTNPDWIFVCTPHHVTCNIVKQAITAGKNVLVEKPLGRTVSECREVTDYIINERVCVGFNYRYYLGVNMLLNDVKSGKFGELISVNMVLGLGDGPGSEKTWRLDPEKAGSGALLDPGIHLIDLAMIISNNTLYSIDGEANNSFWKTGIEEEVHLLARSKLNTIFNIQASKVRWRNTFRIEVNGTDGYGIVEGRNRNYGYQTYRTGVRWGWLTGKSQKESESIEVNYDGEDSFIEETRAVLFGTEGIQPGTWQDNLRCLEFIERV